MYILIISLLSALFIWIIYIYNRLVINRNRMQEAWSIIDVFLKKRYELVPMLVDTVKGYAIYEQKVFEEVAYLRSDTREAIDRKEKVIYENRFEEIADRLFLNIENYPQLKADNHFLKLQHELSEIENDLEKARRYYNGTVRENNIFQESFPSNLIASIFGFSKGIFFTVKGKNISG